MDTNEADLRKAIEEAARDIGGKQILACAQALRLATEHQVSPAVVGRVCNEQGIKIANCQLGCFG